MEVQCGEYRRKVKPVKPHVVQRMSSSCGVWEVEDGAGGGGTSEKAKSDCGDHFDVDGVVASRINALESTVSPHA
jgi:hypothetical protein